MIDRKTKKEKRAEKEIIDLLKSEERGWTQEKIMDAAGLGWDLTILCLSRLCRGKQVECVPHSHTANGLRVEYRLI
ncbi:MAG: hypothetical protein COT59_00680 [Candidatus Nealsonbacteria bacterium CG09_land_8_20_14_0_10_42_14]|uniref:Transcriptional regulator n=1 Tax=Candidatus Nealsonbacteria bacterium CG09_land_8_20_14_0_10_42_14 TaxID=1974707 RepID=A0A2H0WZR7_9BACT|nr:MAG: hypothetical protein COT59_00680 [Candidatus Nealsonbacteria bacterium CG09_land_8_20_14_0_10_42_14]